MKEENETLDKIHELHLILADELKRICEKNNIRYFMIAGTLLGAVRHHGFIPWDDDMDFGIMRKDFDKFVEICDQELNDDVFYLQTDSKEKNYAFNFAKLTLKGTTLVQAYTESAKIHLGIYIDIFPVDVVPDNPLKKRIQFLIFGTAKNLLLIKLGYGEKTTKKIIRYNMTHFIAKIFPVKLLKKIENDSITRFSDQQSKFVVVSGGNYGLKKETILRAWTEKIEYYPFEDRVYPGISDYKEYLSYFYGDYMTLPPEAERDHHDRMKVDFGEYDNLKCDDVGVKSTRD